VITSAFGKSAAGILCLSSDTFNKPTFPKDAFRDPESKRRTLMHAKILCPDSPNPAWFYIGSHNFSIAAWGRPKAREPGMVSIDGDGNEKKKKKNLKVFAKRLSTTTSSASYLQQRICPLLSPTVTHLSPTRTPAALPISPPFREIMVPEEARLRMMRLALKTYKFMN